MANLDLTLNLRTGKRLNYWRRGSLISAKLASTGGLNEFFPAANQKDSLKFACMLFCTEQHRSTALIFCSPLF